MKGTVRCQTHDLKDIIKIFFIIHNNPFVRLHEYRKIN